MYGEDIGFAHNSQILAIACTVELFHPKSMRGRLNAVLNVSAEIGTGDSVIRILLRRSERSAPPSSVKGAMTTGGTQSTAQILGQCSSPSSLEQSSCFTVSKHHWTGQREEPVLQKPQGGKIVQLSAIKAVTLSREL